MQGSFANEATVMALNRFALDPMVGLMKLSCPNDLQRRGPIGSDEPAASVRFGWQGSGWARILSVSNGFLRCESRSDSADWIWENWACQSS